MELNEAEKEYYIKLYNHGINHLINDTIPNRIICVHNLHWILEDLLRKTTKDFPNIEYRDGFKDIFTKFCTHRSITVSPKFKEAILKFNKIRNDMEHRQLFHNINDIQDLISEVKNFIQWIVKKRFNTTINLHSIPSADEREIFKDFMNWTENKSISQERGEGGIFDYIFLCIIPTSYSPQLIDMSRDTINEFTPEIETGDSNIHVSMPNPEYRSKIEEYFNNLRQIFYGDHQIYTISPYFRYYEDFYGNEMRIYRDGRIYICYYYRRFNPEDPTFSLKSIMKKEYNTYIIKNTSKKYGLDFDRYKPGNLDDILKLVCFPFTEECKIPIVKIPTNYFKSQIILPNMRYDGKNRTLDSEEIFSQNRVYAGDDKNIVFEKLFSYSQIDDVVNEFIKWVYGYYTNIRSTSFSR